MSMNIFTDQFTLMVREMIPLAAKVFKVRFLPGTVFVTFFSFQAKQSFLLRMIVHNEPLLKHLEFLYPHDALAIRSQFLREWHPAAGLGIEKIKIPPITERTIEKWSNLQLQRENALNKKFIVSPEISKEEEDLLYQLLFLEHRVVLLNTNIWLLKSLLFVSFLV